MRGAAQERKLLHEHELVLATFTFVFLVGGFIFWGYDVVATGYYLGDSEDPYTTTETFEALLTEEKIVDVAVRNTADPALSTTALVIIDLDEKCAITTGELPILSDPCSLFTTTLLGDSTLNPGEATFIRIAFTSEIERSATLTLNVITNDGIDTMDFSFNAVTELTKPATQDSLVGTTQTDAAFFTSLLDALRAFLGGDGVVVPEALEDPVVYVHGLSSLGFTEPSLFFGSLNIEQGAQATQSFAIENIGTTTTSVTGITKPTGLIVTPLNGFTLAPGERQTVEVTCTPQIIGGLETPSLLFHTARGDAPLRVLCIGVTSVTEDTDRTKPILTVVQPVEGQVRDTVSVRVEAYDEGTIADLALVKAYIGSTLVKRLNTPTTPNSHVYEFDVDLTRFTGIVAFTVEAVDYAGNTRVSEPISLWITAEETETDTVVQPLEDVEEVTEEIVIELPELNVDLLVRPASGSGYTDLSTDHVVAGDRVDLRLTSTLEGTNYRFEFKNAALDSISDLSIDSEDIVFKTMGDGRRIIDIPDDTLKSFITLLDATSVILPMIQPDGYEMGKPLEVTYYKNNGDTYVVSSTYIKSFSQEGDIIYVELDKRVIFGDV